jgi:hypothetical protein
MCLVDLLMTSDDGPLCLEATWLGPMCAGGLEMTHGERVFVLKRQSLRWSTTETDGRIFIPCYGCAAAIILDPTSCWDNPGSAITATRDSRAHARARLFARTRRSTWRRT